jgi:hypothetical protein
MERKKAVAVSLFAALSVLFLTETADAADADDQPAPASSNTNSATGDTRFGLFNALDHRSVYNQEFFPEPLLVEDMDLEDNQLEFSWLHTKAHGLQNDSGTIEYQKGFGLLTLQIDIPYERNVAGDQISQGVGNIELGARYPFYQWVSANGMFDTTFGGALEGGFPAQLHVSRNADIEPEAFNELKLGNHFAVQTVLGYSALFSGGDDGGLRTFEYGVNFSWIIPRRQLPIPGVTEFDPMFELIGETGLNEDESGQNSLLGDVGFRVKFKPIDDTHPGLGFGYVFPLDNVAREEVRQGFFISLVFEF